MQYISFVLWMTLFPITLVLFEYLGKKIAILENREPKQTDSDLYAKIILFYLFMGAVLFFKS